MLKLVSRPLPTRVLTAQQPAALIDPMSDFMPELHRARLGHALVAIWGEHRRDKKGNTADAKQKRNN